MLCKIPWHKIVPGASETASWRATSRNNIVQTDVRRFAEICSRFLQNLVPSAMGPADRRDCERSEHGGSPSHPQSTL